MCCETKCNWGVGGLISVILLFGFWEIADAIKTIQKSDLISTEGSAEIKVKSDIAEVRLVIKNKNENFTKLYQKRIADKEKVLAFLKECGFTVEEIYSSTAKTENLGEKEGRFGTTTISNQEKYFSSEDVVSIRTSDFAKVDKLREQIMQLASEGIIISYKYKYKITDLKKLGTDLLSEAVKDAEKNANALLKPFNMHVKKIHRIENRYYSLEVINEAQNSSWSSWEKEGETSSVMKKVKQKVNVDFIYE